MNGNDQFSGYQKGLVDLPSSVRLLRVAAARCQEILAMRKALSSGPSGSKLIFQTLPKYMRRRVMSHNAKRLPRRLREVHLNQLKKSGLPPKQKMPSRKYRRRPRNLLEEYNRRQQKIKWLETHIWHAKRFHMVNRWGYRIPYSPCDKAFRACYRATAKHCLMQDLSYYGCIEITGNEEVIVGGIKKLCDPKLGLSVDARAYIRGNREGTLMFFTLNDKKPIGHVTFNWMSTSSDKKERALWIWSHPANFEDILSNLIMLYDLKQSNNFYININTGLILRDLRFELNRFRLTGPLSQSVLQKSLKYVNLDDCNSQRNWLKDYGDPSNMTILKSQRDYWRNIQNIASPNVLSPHIMLSIIGEDPRYNMPKKRTKALPDNHNIESKFLYELPENLSQSPIWNADIRNSVKENQIPTSQICELRSKLLVPGTDLPTPGMPVPYLLIQRPGNRNDNLGYCSGWDVIIPSHWGQATWITMIMWGARAGGLRELDSMEFEMGRPHILEPDTLAGQLEEERLSNLRCEKYFRLPPNRRTNYAKFAVASPFHYNWKILVKDWNSLSEYSDNFSVLRDRKILQTLQDVMRGSKNVLVNISDPYLVPIKVIMETKGCPTQLSMICLPKTQDLKKSAIIREPMRKDPNQDIRKRLRDEHKTLMMKARRSRIKAKTKGKVVTVDKEQIVKQKERMETLWVPKVENIRNSCSREIMGFITKGGFSFTHGQAIGVGYVTLSSLQVLASQICKNKVLIRNTTSRQYRIAKIEVVI